MRKSVILFLVLLISFVFVSCSDDIDVPQSNNASSYIVPFFAIDKQQNTRGLTTMPVGGPWGTDNGIWRSSAVMQTIPAMIGFEELRRNNFEEVKAEAVGRFHLIGFDIEADINAWHENNDGFYMKYDVFSNENTDSPIGMIQYYFNKKENMFSYRQMIMLTYLMDINGMKDFSAETFIILLEFKDIPVRNINQVRGFSFGGLKNGKIEKDAFVDYIRLKAVDGSYRTPGISFSRSYISGMSDKNLFQSFMHKDLEYSTDAYDDDQIYNLINSLANNDEDNNIIDTKEESLAADLDFIYDVIPYFYKNSEKIIQGDSDSSDFKPYSSYEDFNSASLSDVKELIVDKCNQSDTSYVNSNPVIFSWSGNSSASAQTGGEDGLPTSNSFVGACENIEKTDFPEFYDLEGLEGDELIKKLIEEHLNACSIYDKNYIANFTYAEMTSPYSSWKYEVTNENPEIFKSHFNGVL